MTEHTYFYRFEGMGPLRLKAYPIEKFGNKTWDGSIQEGTWISTTDPETPRRKTSMFIRQGAALPFACATVEEARQVFIDRREARAKKHERKAQRARESIKHLPPLEGEDH